MDFASSCRLLATSTPLILLTGLVRICALETTPNNCSQVFLAVHMVEIAGVLLVEEIGAPTSINHQIHSIHSRHLLSSSKNSEMVNVLLGCVFALVANFSVASVPIGGSKHLSAGLRTSWSDDPFYDVHRHASQDCMQDNEEIGNGLIRGMMKFAGYSLTAPFTPVYPNILKNYSRLPFDIFKRNWTKSCSVSVHTKKDQVLANAVMVAEQYLPPWCRTLARLISKHAWLYTEMLAAETIVYQKDNLDRFLAFSPEQHPIVLNWWQ
ncbi:hypothetical protein FH972_010787 [Carpinus fangiana]|uniref:Uncharacterized protein n=1 Tax=Carpinus fangiana TaxID=176857 RepID=A0A660KVE2_9ROSI|nr:hypothetical protein FH972_010787 [Carpinus fangiana]